MCMLSALEQKQKVLYWTGSSLDRDSNIMDNSPSKKADFLVIKRGLCDVSLRFFHEFLPVATAAIPPVICASWQLL